MISREKIKTMLMAMIAETNNESIAFKNQQEEQKDRAIVQQTVRNGHAEVGHEFILPPKRKLLKQKVKLTMNTYRSLRIERLNIL